MSTVTQQIEHARRAIAYALWNAAADGRTAEDLFCDQKWINDLTGKFLAIQITEGLLPCEQIQVTPPREYNGSTHLRRIVEEHDEELAS